ncbi:hypothetical protein I315_04525 [Cryptococcus gattii Ru294]|nr:hypothetical protein I315_04525 [Cryptococcus gattii Ru294]
MRPTTTTKRQQSSVSRLIDPLLPSALDSLPTLSQLATCTVPGRQGHLPAIRRSLLLHLRRFQRQ